MLGAHFAVGPARGAADVAHRAEGARRAVGLVVVARTEGGDALLELGRAGGRRALEGLRGDAAVLEEADGGVDASDAEALVAAGLETLADDHLGACAADVDDEAALLRGWQRLRAALEDEAGLLMPREDVDRIAERCLGLGEELPGVRRDAQRLRADGAHALGGQPREAFVEAGERGERAGLDLRRERAVLVKASGETNRLLPVALGDDSVALKTADLNAEAVAAEVNGAK